MSSTKANRDDSDLRRPDAGPGESPTTRVSRRGFLGVAGAGLGAAVAAPALARSETPVDKGPELAEAGERVPVVLQINGREHRVLVEPRWSLLHVLREELGITGTKLGCARGECGACTVLLGDEPRYSCLTLALEAEGSEITTVEGLLDGEDLGPVQQAFVEHDAFQCGYCTPGQVMAVEGLLRANPDPDLEEIRTGVSGNLCRCGAYPNIFRAAERAAELKEEEAQ